MGAPWAARLPTVATHQTHIHTPCPRRCPLPPVQKARENAGSALFLELLFWKGANVADDVRNEYNWRVGAVTLGECVCEFWGGLGRW